MLREHGRMAKRRRRDDRAEANPVGDRAERADRAPRVERAALAAVVDRQVVIGAVQPAEAEALGGRGLLLVPSGRFGDVRGRRAVFVGALALFTLASAACGAAQSSLWLVVARLGYPAGFAACGAAALACVPLAFLTRKVDRV